MKAMLSAKLPECPPNGTYEVAIAVATAGFTNVKTLTNGASKGGDSQIALTLEIASGQFAGHQMYDNLGTDGGTSYGAVSKKRLRALGVQGLDSDAEVPDEIVAQNLLGRRVFAVCEREQRTKLNEATNKWEPQLEVDEKTGQKAPVYKLRVIGYTQQPTAGAQQGAPQQLQAPQGQQLPSGFPQQLPGPQGFPQQMQQAPAGWPGAQQTGFPAPPQGFAPPQQIAAPAGWGVPPNGVQGAPQGYPQQGQPGLPFPGQPPR